MSDNLLQTAHATIAVHEATIAQIQAKQSQIDAKVDLILEYVNQQKGRAQAIMWMAGSLGLTSGGLSTLLVLSLKAHP